MEAEDFIKHHGIKGMQWGIRRYQPYPKGEGHKGKFLKKLKKKASDSRVGQEVRSVSRELKTLSTKKNMDNMSTKEIKEKGRRIQLENEMKKLSSSKKEKKDYRNRGRMSEQEINRKMDRLRAKDLLSQNADKASKKHIEMGKRVGESIASMAVTYVTNNNNISVDQIYDAIANPKDSRNKALLSSVANNKKAKELLKKVVK